MPRHNYGGQALIEGVLMRGRNAIAVGMRHPDGRIVFVHSEMSWKDHVAKTLAAVQALKAKR